MSLPPIIQPTDTFNTWFDATNNLISHVSNTSAYVLVNNTAQGNVSVTGTVTTATLVANGNVVLGGLTTGCTTPVFKLTTNGVSDTAAIIASNVSIAATNTVISGTDLTIAPNTVINGKTTLTGNLAVTLGATFSNTIVVTGNTTFSNTLAVTGNTTFSNTLAVTGNTTFSNTLAVTGATTLSNTLGVTGAATLSNTLGVTGATTLSNTLAITGTTTFNAGMVLGGPIEWKSTFIETDAALTGAGTAAPLPVQSNTSVYRFSSAVSKSIAGVEQANTAQPRSLILVNVGDTDVFLEHANTGATTNAFYCAANTNALLPRQGAAHLYYDTTITRWRVIGTSFPEANTTANGYVTTTTQSFAGAKTFTGRAFFTGGLSIDTTDTSADFMVSNSGAEGIEISAATASGVSTIQSISRSPLAWNRMNMNALDYTFNCNGTTPAMSLSSAGLLTVSGAGSHTFAASNASGGNNLTLRNTASASAAYSSLSIGNDTLSYLGTITAWSSGAATTGFSEADGVSFVAYGAGGMKIGTNSNYALKFYQNATVALTLGASQAATFSGAVNVHGILDLNNSANSRLVLPVGADKWSV